MKAEARFRLEGRAEAVREGIAQVMANPPVAGLAAEERAVAELVLAEVLNNIVEHAYGGAGGLVELHLRREKGGGLFCQISDRGRPLLSNILPLGQAPSPEDLAEGGYGWFLIRALARDLNYFRQGGHNKLSFRLLPDTRFPAR